MGRSAAFSNSVESFWLIIRIEYRAEYLGREELETLALFVGLLPQSADIEVHPALHRAMDCLADVPSASVTGRDAPSPAHIQVPQEDADGFLLPLPMRYLSIPPLLIRGGSPIPSRAMRTHPSDASGPLLHGRPNPRTGSMP